ncbi:MAG: von Willebrand factor type A domain-containing protein, partial [Planctomycetia bacterium]|nr:von Willebrand factor type A domain-containing protein [Planctomycetia bacterium]
MFDGLVTGVRVKGDDTYAHFSIGSDAGVQVGHEVEVFHDGKSVGKMVVIRVTPEGSVAKMEPGHKGEIVRGDRIETLTNGKLTDEQPAPAEPEQGQGPGAGGDRYRHIQENPFLASLQEPLSTFSIDVDTASYSNIRQFMMEQGVLPPPDAVRIEELVNYFHDDYAPPQDKRPCAAHIEAARCPWQPEHYLVRVALKGREVKNDTRPRANLVFLVDVSGSMNEPDRLPLVIRGLKLLTEQLRNDDHVAIVV